MVIDDETFKSFYRVGKDLSNRKLNASHSGNISIRSGGKIIIKKRAAMLGWLEKEDLVECDMDHEDSSAFLASTELIVHREIYKQTDAMAVIHAHAPYCTTLSMIMDDIKCIDAEGIFMYKRIPVVEVDVPAGPYDAAKAVPPILKNYPACIIRSHGIFAKGNTLEDALQVVTGVEQSAEIIYLTLLAGKPLKRDYSVEKEFCKW
jgi:L-fuculose-phosphate aldolase